MSQFINNALSRIMGRPSVTFEEGMRQRFYYRTYEEGRYHVFMGNRAMEEIGGGLLVQEVGYEEAAKLTVNEYTRLFNDMVSAEECTITESL